MCRNVGTSQCANIFLSNKKSRVKMLIIYFILTVRILTSGYILSRSPKNDYFETGGIPNAKDLPLLNRKIFKGTRVAIREHPYVVSIRRLFSHYLTGSLISYNTVLTVAHPVYGVSTEELAVVAAENYADRGKSIDPVVFMIIHEDFDPNTLENDLAMLRVYDDFHFMTNIKTIRLIGPRGQVLGHQAFVTGWGRCDFTRNCYVIHHYRGRFPSRLVLPAISTSLYDQSCYPMAVRIFNKLPDEVRDLPLPIFKKRTNIKTIRLIGPRGQVLGHQAFVTGWGRCDFTGKELCLPRSNRFYPQEVQDPMLRTVTFTATRNPYCSQYDAKEVPLKPGMICLGTSRMEEPMTSCLGVPGAPLVVRGRLAGILSWGLGCGYIFDMPLVYVDLHYYRPWVSHNLEKMSRIPRESLTKFYLASKSYIVEKSINKTRNYLEKRLQAIQDYDLQLFDVDLVLVNMVGTAYDLRDFIYDGIFHNQKLKLYSNTKRTIKKNVAALEIYNNYTRQPLSAFLDPEKLQDIGLEMQGGNILSRREEDTK